MVSPLLSRDTIRPTRFWVLGQAGSGCEVVEGVGARRDWRLGSALRKVDGLMIRAVGGQFVVEKCDRSVEIERDKDLWLLLKSVPVGFRYG